MTPRTTTEYRRNWYFRRSRIRAQKEWYDRFLKTRKSKAPRKDRKKARARSLMMEALEPRVLFSGAVPTTSVDLDQPGTQAELIDISPATDSTIVPAAPTIRDQSSDADVLASQTANNNTAEDPLADPNNPEDQNLPNEEMIGETINFAATFSNSGAPGQIGYAPYMDLIIPSGINMDADGDGTITASTDVGGLTMDVEPIAKLFEFDFGDPAISAVFGGAHADWTNRLGVDGTTGGTTRIWVPYNHPAIDGEDFALNFGFGAPPSTPADSQFVSGGPGGVGTASHTGVHFVQHPILDSLNVGVNDPQLAAVSAYNPAFNDGDVLYSVQFPFGSFSPGNPPINLEFEGVLDPNMGATIDQSMFIRSVGGFALGCDPLNNPGTLPGAVEDSPIGGVNAYDDVTIRTGLGGGEIYGSINGTSPQSPDVPNMGSDYVTPKVVEIKKDEQSNNHENATGPSNPIHYRIDVDIAEGQTLHDLVISDVIPPELVYVPNSVTISINGNAISNGLEVYQPWEINPGSGYDADDFVSGAGGSGQLDEMEARDFSNLNGGLLQIFFDSVVADSLDGEDDFLNFTDGDGRLGDGDRWDITIEYQAYAPEFFTTPGDVTMSDGTTPAGVPAGIPMPTSAADFFDNRQVGGEVLGYNGDANDSGAAGQGNNPNTGPGNPPGDDTLNDPGNNAVNSTRIDAIADIDGDGLFAKDFNGDGVIDAADGPNVDLDEGFADFDGDGYGDPNETTEAGRVWDFDTGGPFGFDFDGDGMNDLVADLDGDGNPDESRYGSHPDGHIDVAELVDGDEATIELDPMKVDKHLFGNVDENGDPISGRGPDSQLTPGSFVGFEIDIDVSDFHAFDNFFLEDYLGDGFELVSNAEATFGQMFDEDSGVPNGVTVPGVVHGPMIAMRAPGLAVCDADGDGDPTNDGIMLGTFDPVTGEPTAFAPFVDPSEVINLGAGTPGSLPVNPLTGEPIGQATDGDGDGFIDPVFNNNDEVGGDLMTWNFSHQFDSAAYNSVASIQSQLNTLLPAGQVAGVVWDDVNDQLIISFNTAAPTIGGQPINSIQDQLSPNFADLVVSGATSSLTLTLPAGGGFTATGIADNPAIDFDLFDAVGGSAGAGANLETLDGVPYATGDQFGLFVNGDANGDGRLSLDEATFLGNAALAGTAVGTQNMTDANTDNIPDALAAISLDVDGDGRIDGIDITGDGFVDGATYLAGGLFDPLNQAHLNGAGDHNVANCAADGTDATDGGAADGLGYHYFYEVGTDGNGDPIFVGDQLEQQDPSGFHTTGGVRTLHEDVPEQTRIVIRFYARVSDTHDFEDNFSAGSGSGNSDVGVDLNDNLSNFVSVEGDELLYTDSDGTVPNDNGLIDTNGDGVGDTPAPDVDGDGNPGSDVDGDGTPDGPYGETYQDDGGEFVEISRPSIEKDLVAINGESILDQDDNDGVRDAFDNISGAVGSDGSVDEPAVGVGGSVTYRLRMELPFASVENFNIIDSLPLPVFDLAAGDYQSTQFIGNQTLENQGVGTPLEGTGPALISDSSLPDAALNGAMQWTYGPDHFIPGNVNITNAPDPPAATDPHIIMTPFNTGAVGGKANNFLPEIRFNPANNQVSWHFGTWEMALEEDADGDLVPDGRQTTVIDLLFTVRVNEQPFADGLFLTNQAEFAYSDTRGTDSVNSIVQIETLAPDLQIRKGVLAVSPQGQPGGFNFDSNGGNGPGLYDNANENIANHEWAAYGEDDHYQTQTSGLSITGGVNGTGDDNMRFNSVKGLETGKNIGVGQYQGGGAFHPENSGTKDVEFEGLRSQYTQSEQDRGRVFLGNNTRLDQVRTNNNNQLGNDNSQWVVPGSIEIIAVQNVTEIQTVTGAPGSTHSVLSTNAGPNGGLLLEDGATGNDLVFVDIPNADGLSGNIVDPSGTVLATIDYESGQITGAGISAGNQFGSGDYFPEGLIDLFVSYDIHDVLIQSNDGDADYESGAYDQVGGPTYTITNGSTAGLNNTTTPQGAPLNFISSGNRIDPTTVNFDIGGLDNITDDGAGNLVQSSTGTRVGFINYNTGVYKFDITGTLANSTIAVPHAVNLSFSHGGGTLFDTTNAATFGTYNPASYVANGNAAPAPGSGVPGAVIISTLEASGDVGNYNLAPGSVRFSIDDTPGQIILVDVPDSASSSGAYSGTVGSEAISGALHIFDQTTGNIGPAVGVINYNDGDYSFKVQVQDGGGNGEAEVKVDYDRWQGAEHYITSNYLHSTSEFTAEGDLSNWAAFVDSDARNLDAGDVVTWGIFVENIGGGNAFEVELFDTFFNNIQESQVGAVGGGNANDDSFNDTHLLPATTGFNGAPNDSSAATNTQIENFLDAFNFKAYKGDGTELEFGTDFIFEYNRGSGTLGGFQNNGNQGSGLDYRSPNAGDESNDGFWQFVLVEGQLDAGRSGGDIMTNDSGSNILYITYDTVIDQSATPGHRVTNDAILTNYTANPINSNPGDAAETFADADGDGRFDEDELFIDANGNGVWDSETVIGDINGNGIIDDSAAGIEYIDLDGNNIWDHEYFVDSNDDVNGDTDGVWTMGETFTDLNSNGTFDDSYANQLDNLTLVPSDGDVKRDGADIQIAGLNMNKVLIKTDQSHTGDSEVTINNVRDGLFGFDLNEEGQTWNYAINLADFSDTDNLTMNGETDNNGTAHTAIPHDYIRLAGGTDGTGGNSAAGSRDNTIDADGLKSIDLDAGTVTSLTAPTNTTNADAFPNTYMQMSSDNRDSNGMTTSFFHNQPQNISGDWESEFEFTISNRDGQVTRGFAFVIHNDPAGAAALATGSGNEDHSGFDDRNGADRIDNAFALEFRSNFTDYRLLVSENPGSGGGGQNTRETNLGNYVGWVNDSDGNDTNENTPVAADEDTVIKARLTYDSDSHILYVTVRDEYGHEVSYQHTVDESIAEIVGGQNAYVGFTSANDGQNSLLINNWSLKTGMNDDFHNADINQQADSDAGNGLNQTIHQANSQDGQGVNGIGNNDTNNRIENFSDGTNSHINNQEAIDSGEDVTVGEEVVYGLVVTVPEGDMNGFAIYDNLPPGLEIVDWELVTDPNAAGILGGNVDAQDILRATHHTDTPFTTAWGGGDLNGWQNNIVAEQKTGVGTYAPLQAGYTSLAANLSGTIRFSIGNNVGGLINQPDNDAGANYDPRTTNANSQDDDPNNVRDDQATSESNNTFMIAIRARVVNDVETSPYEGGNDLATVHAENGAGETNVNGDTELNTAYVRYNGGGITLSGTAVSLDIVEPDLEIDKTVFNKTNPLRDNDNDQNVGSNSSSFHTGGEDIDGDGILDLIEDLDGDGNFDITNEDLNFDGNLDVFEDLNFDGNLDVFEDLNGNGVLDAGEDMDGDGVLDLVNEDVDGDGVLDLVNEDLDGDGNLDLGNEDLNGNGIFDLTEDSNGNGVLDPGEDIDGDGVIDVFEDADGDGVLDAETHNDEIAKVGDTLTFRLEVGHSGTSTGDAFNLNLEDNIAAAFGGFLDPDSVAEVRLLSPPAYLLPGGGATGNTVDFNTNTVSGAIAGGAAGVGAVGPIANPGANAGDLTLENGQTVSFYTLFSGGGTPGTAGTVNTTLGDPIHYTGSGNNVDFDVSRLELGDRLIIEIDVVVNTSNPTALSQIDLFADDDPDPSIAASSSNDDVDVRNVANLTYYSVDDESPWGAGVENLFDADGINEEAREYTASDDANVAIIASDIDLGIVKGVLNVLTANPVNFVSDQAAVDMDGDGCPDLPLDGGGFTEIGTGHTETDLPTNHGPFDHTTFFNFGTSAANVSHTVTNLDDLVDSQTDQTDYDGNPATTSDPHNNWSANLGQTNIVPETVEFEIQSRLNQHYVNTAGAPADLIVLKDLGGANINATQGYLYMGQNVPVIGADGNPVLDANGNAVIEFKFEETHTPVGIVDYATGDVEIFQTLFHHEEERVEVDYEFERHRSQIENPDGTIGGPDGNPDRPNWPGEHDLSHAEATITGESAVDGNQVVLSAINGDLQNARFRHSVIHASAHEVNKNGAEPGGFPNAVDPNFNEAEIVSGSVRVHVFDRHGEYILVDDGNGGFGQILDANGNPIPAAALGIDTADQPISQVITAHDFTAGDITSQPLTMPAGVTTISNLEDFNLVVKHSSGASLHFTSDAAGNLTTTDVIPGVTVNAASITAAGLLSIDLDDTNVGATADICIPGANHIDYSWNTGGFSFHTKEFLSINQVTFDTFDPSATPSNLTSEFLHPDNTSAAGTSDPYGMDTVQWNSLIDQDVVTPQNLNQGDVVTYGIFIENRGSDEAFDITISDALFTGGLNGINSLLTPANWVGGTVYDVTAGLTGMNFQAIRGDGTSLTFTATYNAVSGDIQIAFDDIDTDNDNVEDSGVLQGGRSEVGGVWTNTAGTNVIMLTYDVTIGTPNVGQTYELNNIAGIDSYSLSEGGPDVSDLDPTKDNVDGSQVEFVAVSPDLQVTKNDGIQIRAVGETYDYTLSYLNQAVHDDGVTPTGPALGVVITDTLPSELTFVGAAGFTEAADPNNPQPGEFVITNNPDGTTSIAFHIGTLQPGETGQILLEVEVTAELEPGRHEIVNKVSISSINEHPDVLDDNEDEDIDILIIPEIENPDPELFGGSRILQGFRYEDPGFRFEEEEDPLEPILELMPIYSGLADPGTVLRIKIMGDTGAPLPNGDMTVVADAGGNWLAKFPGLILREEPHMIVIEQTAPTWNTGNKEHGFNFRTYFAPAISPTHAQMEEINVGDTLARRLSAVVIDSMSSHDEDNASHSNSDWRLANYEWFCQSGIGGVLR